MNQKSTYIFDSIFAKPDNLNFLDPTFFLESEKQRTDLDLRLFKQLQEKEVSDRRRNPTKRLPNSIREINDFNWSMLSH